MTRIQEILAANIKRLRKAKGWTQNDLAVHAGISFRGLQSVEVGDRNPRRDTLAAIAGALGVTEAQLFEDPERGQSTEMLTPAEMTKDLSLELDRIKSEFSKIKLDDRMSAEVNYLRSALDESQKKSRTLETLVTIYGPNFIDALLKATSTEVLAVKGLLGVLPPRKNRVPVNASDQNNAVAKGKSNDGQAPVARKKAAHER